MSYYSRNHKSSIPLSLIIILLIAILLLRSCTSSVIWNNGICPNCGGKYIFKQAIGHRSFTDYMYVCDQCGRAIETSHYYPDN